IRVDSIKFLQNDNLISCKDIKFLFNVRFEYALGVYYGWVFEVIADDVSAFYLGKSKFILVLA
ncbi:hypothetical protein, partial [Helicobacter typhlonius]|uniref:hypothetical protein n=1 Tax=Helicobacter typhlonius TaxID=76936 RepID=UPI002FE25BA8